MSDDAQPNFRVLKVVVVVLGIAILVMTGIIIYKATELFSGVAATEPAPAASSGATVRRVERPGGPAWSYDAGDSRVIDAQISDGLMLLLVEDAGGVIRAVLLDPSSGRTLGEAVGK